ncbi:hypothetical protein AHAS_Ahas16G0110600 [Arachis hypogaea]
MEIGAYAAEQIFELEPSYSGTRILLANIYASAGRWKDVAKVRKIMKDSGLKKEPTLMVVANGIRAVKLDPLHSLIGYGGRVERILY